MLLDVTVSQIVESMSLDELQEMIDKATNRREYLMTVALNDEEKELIKAQNRISAIKAVRNRWNCGLRTAVECVRAYERNGCK